MPKMFIWKHGRISILFAINAVMPCCVMINENIIFLVFYCPKIELIRWSVSDSFHDTFIWSSYRSYVCFLMKLGRESIIPKKLCKRYFTHYFFMLTLCVVTQMIELVQLNVDIQQIILSHKRIFTIQPENSEILDYYDV